MRVLLGLGPDESALGALDTTIERLGETGDDLTVAVFGDPEDRETLAGHARERLSAADFTADVREIDGHPGSRLVELAEQEEFDRIAIPGGKQSPLGKIQFDNVTEFVLLNSNTTVTLIR